LSASYQFDQARHDLPSCSHPPSHPLSRAVRILNLTENHRNTIEYTPFIEITENVQIRMREEG
jgi:hypothetical protein